MSERITRRAFLGAAAGLGAGAAVARVRPWTALVRIIRPTDAERLARLFADPSGVRALGNASLRALGGRHTAAGLADLVAASLPNGRRSITAESDDGLRELLAERIRDDFTAGRMVDVEGWQLSVTETRLYAITVLAGPGRPARAVSAPAVAAPPR